MARVFVVTSFMRSSSCSKLATGGCNTALSPASSKLFGKDGPQAKTTVANPETTAARKIAALKFFDFKLHLTVGLEPQPADDHFFAGRQTE